MTYKESSLYVIFFIFCLQLFDVRTKLIIYLFSSLEFRVIQNFVTTIKSVYS
jgi:hypothetical protein